MWGQSQFLKMILTGKRVTDYHWGNLNTRMTLFQVHDFHFGDDHGGSVSQQRYMCPHSAEGPVSRQS